MMKKFLTIISRLFDLGASICFTYGLLLLFHPLYADAISVDPDSYLFYLLNFGEEYALWRAIVYAVSMTVIMVGDCFAYRITGWTLVFWILTLPVRFVFQILWLLFAILECFTDSITCVAQLPKGAGNRVAFFFCGCVFGTQWIYQ